MIRCRTPAFHVRLLVGAVVLLAVFLALPGSASATRDTPPDGPRASSDARDPAAGSVSTPSPAPPNVRVGADAWSETSGPPKRRTITLTGACTTITLTVLDFEAAYTSSFMFKRSESGTATSLNITNREVGATMTLTNLTAGDFILGIRVQDTGNEFWAGPGSRNPDGRVHARMSGSTTVSFEDFWDGGDEDFDDAVLLVTQTSCVVDPPRPPPLEEEDTTTDDSGTPPGDTTGGTPGGTEDGTEDGAEDGTEDGTTDGTPDGTEDDASDEDEPPPDSDEGTPPEEDAGERAGADSCGLSVLPVPPPGGWTHGVSDTSDIDALIAAQRFPVASVWVFDVAAQVFLGHGVGRPDFVNSLDASTLAPGSVVIMRRTDDPADPAGDATPAAAGASQRDEPSVLPVPPPGGWTYGVACTSDIEALIAVQQFEVVAVWVLDVAAQAFLGYGVGAPAAVNTLDAASLHPDSVVIMSRAAPAPPPVAPDDAPDDDAAEEAPAEEAPAGDDDDTPGPIALPNTGSGGLGGGGRAVLPVALAVSLLLALGGVAVAWRTRA